MEHAPLSCSRSTAQPNWQILSGRSSLGLNIERPQWSRIEGRRSFSAAFFMKDIAKKRRKVKKKKAFPPSHLEEGKRGTYPINLARAWLSILPPSKTTILTHATQIPTTSEFVWTFLLGMNHDHTWTERTSWCDCSTIKGGSEKHLNIFSGALARWRVVSGHVRNRDPILEIRRPRFGTIHHRFDFCLSFLLFSLNSWHRVARRKDERRIAQSHFLGSEYGFEREAYFAVCSFPIIYPRILGFSKKDFFFPPTIFPPSSSFSLSFFSLPSLSSPHSSPL